MSIPPEPPPFVTPQTPPQSYYAPQRRPADPRNPVTITDIDIPLPKLFFLVAKIWGCVMALTIALYIVLIIVFLIGAALALTPPPRALFGR